ncbi:hypothetical protein HanRHA438_Chr01g0039721 [Helianthus annuus]|uniref:Transmembrane protein n=1 Tax=Helianthus annuus TaxID=4232 RepID=A0A251VTN7_HELAN|nr:uncharacterized protein LOC110932534 [Helianthus annuus]KAF5823478.1 hypothetical protein HanXRQr2_Chr01g0038751 [Helianthus annuus]KAJ0612813.1 hypothetical protein HanHA300_Chr01g0031521 [Helianthus annuus]KAJ0624421.1 hypothetical protein HanIR_Chr01g0042871 [Helianthus annuus]KAJ0628199.1 hypothetical protein HanHA89_Chr01g0034061 [Helianthus annuus]KAJ0784488.1 hypothetical protein HanLR1_Chr01g0032571 [Helianthus annuus]
MSIQKIVIHRYNVDQPQPLLEVQTSSKHRFAEFAGGTTAECAVVCCCIPISLVNLFVLAVYGVPAGLFRKAMRRKRRRRVLKKGLVIDDGDLSGYDRSSCDGAELLIRYDAAEMLIGSPVMKPVVVDSDVIELENEMWGRFYGTGFWRSVSQRVD